MSPNDQRARTAGLPRLRHRNALAAIAAASALSLSIVPPANAAAVAPQKIVSLNLCTDQLLVDLVPRDRIAAVSYLATDRSLSAYARALEGIKQVRGTAEEVLTLKPDLIIAGQYTTSATVDLLRRLGQDVMVVPLASDFPTMIKTIRTIAAAVGAKERGEKVIADFNERIRAARSPIPSRPRAIAYQVGSLISGPHSLMDAIIEAAGYENAARDMHLGPAGRLPLEQLIAHPPDLLVLANAPAEFKTVLADNLRHPALEDLLHRVPSVHLPMTYWLCATPRVAEAVEILAGMKATNFAGREMPR